jgi:3-deoxy-D-manno-octulosonic-acid transferase
MPFTNSFIQQRVRFEQNIDQQYFSSFYLEQVQADVLFHISSEGELEQIYPILQYFLEHKRPVELVYTSPSVDKKCRLLAQRYKHLRILPLPLLGTLDSIHLEHWATAKKLIMCRYDFFPELLYFATVCSDCWLVSASVKKHKKSLASSFSFSTFYWKFVFSFFDYIIPATQADCDVISHIVNDSKILDSVDLRTLRIQQRLENARSVIDSKLSSAFVSYICEFKHTLIVGSGWEAEIDLILSDQIIDKVNSGQLLIYFAPHRLDDGFYELFLQKVDSQISVVRVSRDMDKSQIEQIISGHKPSVIYSQVPGLLCELYSFFDFALIGGGWGRSVHSVLEPYLAGCTIFCGPKTHRSTEVDLVKHYHKQRLMVVNNQSEFVTALDCLLCYRNDKQAIELFTETSKKFDQLIYMLQGSSHE